MLLKLNSSRVAQMATSFVKLNSSRVAQMATSFVKLNTQLLWFVTVLMH